MDVRTDIAGAASDPMMLVRGETLVWANPAAERFLGVAAGKLAGIPIASVLAPGEDRRLGRAIHHQDEGWPMPEVWRLRFQRADGEEVHADLCACAFEDTAGATVVLSMRSAANRLRAERLLARLAALSADDAALSTHEALLDASAPVFIEMGWTVAFTEVLDAGSLTRKVISPPDDPIGAYARSILGRVLPAKLTPILAQVVDEKRPLFLDEVPADIDGPPRSAAALSDAMTRARTTRTAWCPIFSAGRVSHLLAVAGQDLNEHDFLALQTFAHQLGAAMRAAELRRELVHRERLVALGEMAAVLAHEVRNPLAVIYNALSCIRRGVRRLDEDGAMVDDALDAATEEAERLRLLISELLDFARPPVATLQTVALGPEITGAVQALQQPAPPEPPIEIEVHLSDPQIRVEADVGLLRRALVNVLENAMHHAAPGSTVRVSVTPEGRCVSLRVENEGEPPSEIAIARAFEPFFTTRPRGTGLGLAIVRQTMDRMKGSVRLEPTETGARVTLTLQS